MATAKPTSMKRIMRIVGGQQERRAFLREQRELAAELARCDPKIARRCLAVAMAENANPSRSMDGYRFGRASDGGVTMTHFNPMPQRKEPYLTAEEVLAAFKFTWKKVGL